MRPDTEDEFFDRLAPKHDGFCSEGYDCTDREAHINLAYVLPAMAKEIDRLRAAANA